MKLTSPDFEEDGLGEVGELPWRCDDGHRERLGAGGEICGEEFLGFVNRMPWSSDVVPAFCGAASAPGTEYLKARGGGRGVDDFERVKDSAAGETPRRADGGKE